MPQEKERPISSEKVEIKLVLDESLVEKLKELKAYLAHTIPNATYGELIAYMTDKQLEKIKKQKEGQNSNGNSSKVKPDPTEAPCPTVVPDQSAVTSLCLEKAGEKVKQTAHATKREYIPKAIRQAAMARAGNCCEYVSPEGRRCSSRYALEIDHRTPLAL